MHLFLLIPVTLEMKGLWYLLWDDWRDVPTDWYQSLWQTH